MSGGRNLNFSRELQFHYCDIAITNAIIIAIVTPYKPWGTTGVARRPYPNAT